MKYKEDYIFSKDIDWFCIINGIFVHVASGGGSIPHIINNREKLRSIQKEVYKAPYLFEEIQIKRNYEFVENQLHLSGSSVDAYFSSFIEMARKGFVSLDRSNISDPLDNSYHVVCMPPEIKRLKLENQLEIIHCNLELNSPIIYDINLLEFFNKI